MSLTNQLVQILQGMVGFNSPQPQTIAVTEPDVHLELDVTNVDRLSCAFRELRLQVPAFQKTGVDQLKLWADDLCRRVTYLLEQLGAVEIDPVSGQAQIRSTRPDRQDDQTRYYEIVLQNPGLLILRRYQVVAGSARDQIDLQTTLEVLQKLVIDLVHSAQTGN